MRIVFLTVVLIVVGGIHGYLWWRLVASTTRSRGKRLWGAAALLGLVVLVVGTLRTPPFVPEPIAIVVDLIGYFWIAVMFYLFLTLLVLEPLRPVFRRLLRLRHARATTTTARTETARTETARTTVGAGGTGGSGLAAGSPDTAGATDPGEPTGWDPDTGTPAATVLVREPERPTNTSQVDQSRRLFVSRGLALAAGAVAVGTVGYGTVEATRIAVNRVSVTLPRLAPALDGFRFALLADVHISRTARQSLVADVVGMINALDVGAVAIVGDLVDGTVEEIGGRAEPLRDLRSRHGTFFVTGNHEYYSGVREWTEFLPTLGITVLRNERVRVAQNGAAFDLAGIDDRTAAASGEPGHGADLDAARDGRERDRPVVLLAHQPVMWPGAVDRDVDLQLSGHTHGGQLWPFGYLVPLDQPVVKGLDRAGDSQIYVTRGVGTWGPPVRVANPPEITLLELRSPAEGGTHPEG
ncbi:MAG TPA: metallophosphoesterase [Cryptosporangiaceae bacterium]|nr:metallophosphoesterase [Cryptosporangiaceae bacterium]